MLALNIYFCMYVSQGCIEMKLALSMETELKFGDEACKGVHFIDRVHSLAWHLISLWRWGSETSGGGLFASVANQWFLPTAPVLVRTETLCQAKPRIQQGRKTHPKGLGGFTLAPMSHRGRRSLLLVACCFLRGPRQPPIGLGGAHAQRPRPRPKAWERLSLSPPTITEPPSARTPTTGHLAKSRPN